MARARFLRVHIASRARDVRCSKRRGSRAFRGRAATTTGRGFEGISGSSRRASSAKRFLLSNETGRGGSSVRGGLERLVPRALRGAARGATGAVATWLGACGGGPAAGGAACGSAGGATGAVATWRGACGRGSAACSTSQWKPAWSQQNERTLSVPRGSCHAQPRKAWPSAFCWKPARLHGAGSRWASRPRA